MFKGRCLEGTGNLVTFLLNGKKKKIVYFFFFFLKAKRIVGNNNRMFEHDKVSPQSVSVKIFFTAYLQ